MEFQILPMQSDHWQEVRKIYGEGIATGNATFATELPNWKDWDRSHRNDCRLIALEPSMQPQGSLKVLGWAALSPVSSRHIYRGVAEVSVYIATAARRRGVGKSLLQALVQESEANGIWTLQAGIFPENAASLALHKSCGFREVGIRRRIGKLGDVWRDVVLLERRSSNVDL